MARGLPKACETSFCILNGTPSASYDRVNWVEGVFTVGAGISIFSRLFRASARVSAIWSGESVGGGGSVGSLGLCSISKALVIKEAVRVFLAVIKLASSRLR